MPSWYIGSQTVDFNESRARQSRTSFVPDWGGDLRFRRFHVHCAPHKHTKLTFGPRALTGGSYTWPASFTSAMIFFFFFLRKLSVELAERLAMVRNDHRRIFFPKDAGHLSIIGLPDWGITRDVNLGNWVFVFFLGRGGGGFWAKEKWWSHSAKPWME